MTRSRLGLLAGIAGAALSAWWWRRRGVKKTVAHGDDGGEIIYRNTPEPSGMGGGPL